MAAKTASDEGLERQRPGEERAWCARRRRRTSDATITIGTSTAVSSTISRPSPSTPSGVVGAEGLDPGGVLGELEAAVEVVAERHHHGRGRASAARRRARPAWAAPWRGPAGRAAVTIAPTSGSSDQDGEEGEVVHARFTARRASDDEEDAGRAGTGRRSGRSRSGRGAARLPIAADRERAALDDTVDAVAVDDGQAGDQARARA